MSPRRRAFTLVELLVVIAIIGVLLSLMLPAVQAAREAARRLVCMNNLKQMGLAMSLHHEAHRQYPSGWTTLDKNTGKPTASGNPGWAWSAQILPYLEQGSVYGSMNPWSPIYDPANQKGREATLRIFLCPTDGRSESWELAQDPALPTTDPNFPLKLGASSYLAVFGTQDIHLMCQTQQGEGNGVFMRDHRLSCGDISDGLSNTFFVGERSSKTARATWVGVVPNGEHAPCRVVGSGLNSMNSTSDEWHAFRSPHVGGGLFLLGDGSVHFIDQSINFALFQALCTREGGEGVNAW